MLTEKYQKAKVVTRKDYTPDLWSVRIRPEYPLSFEPGQYATLGLETNSRIAERAYSILSSPLESEIEFFFEYVPRGELTPRLHQLQVGDTLFIRRQANGVFTMDTTSGHPFHYLICTVTGVAPYMSMVRTCVREAEQGKILSRRLILLHAASRSWEFAYREELESYACKFPWLTYIPTVSRPWEDTNWKGETGRAEDVLRKHLDSFGLDATNATAYLCGHPKMIEHSKGILQRRGFSKEFIREELYWIPKKEKKEAPE